MGISISGFISKDSNLTVTDLENLLNIKLIFKEDSNWDNLRFGGINFDEIFIIYEKEWIIVYYSNSILEKRHEYVKNVLTKSKEGLHFGLDETSMTFIFEWFENMSMKCEDAYLFHENFEVHGNNTLKLTEDDDIIFDGFFKFLETRIPTLEAETEAKIYKVEIASKNVTEKQTFIKTASSVLHEIADILDEDFPLNGINQLEQLKDKIVLARSMGLKLKHDEPRKIDGDRLKRWIYESAKEWENGIDNDQMRYNIYITALTWARMPYTDVSDMKSGDYLYKRWWEFWKK